MLLSTYQRIGVDGGTGICDADSSHVLRVSSVQEGSGGCSLNGRSNKGEHMMCERSTALGPIKIKVGKVTGCSEADHPHEAPVQY
jgi:hypothetical protein